MFCQTVFTVGLVFMDFLGSLSLLLSTLGVGILAIFVWRTILAVEPPAYQVNLEEISEKIKNYSEENKELVEKISNYEQKIDELKKCLQKTGRGNTILADEARELKDQIETLGGTDVVLSDSIQSTHTVSQCEREEKNVTNQDLIWEREQSIENLNHLISINASELSEVQATIEKVQVTEGKLKTELEQIQEDGAWLQIRKGQLQQKIVECQKEYAELSELIKPLEVSEKHLEGAFTQRFNDVDALTNCISQLNWLFELKSEGENSGINESGDQNKKMRDQKIQMLSVSQAKTAISEVEKDLKLLQSKLRALMSSNCNLEACKKALRAECNLLTVGKTGKEAECQILRTKFKILQEAYEERKKDTEEKLRLDQLERQKRQRQLAAVEEQEQLAVEEMRNCQKRIKEMERQLQQVECSFQHQIALREVKAHEDWVRTRSLERRVTEMTKETAYLKHTYWISTYPAPGAAPRRNINSGGSFPTEEEEGHKVHSAARRPPPFLEPPFRHRLPSPLLGYGPPPPPWWSPRPQPEPPAPPPFGKPI